MKGLSEQKARELIAQVGRRNYEVIKLSDGSYFVGHKNGTPEQDAHMIRMMKAGKL